MKYAKDTAITVGLLLTVVSIVSGIMFDQLGQINAEISKRTELVYSIPATQEDIKEIKQDINEIKMDIKEILKNQ